MIIRTKLAGKGFTLLEIVIVVMVIGAIIMVVLGLPTSMNSVSKSKRAAAALEIAQKKVEDLRISGYANLVNSTTPVSDPRLLLLPQAVGSVDIEDCPIGICTNNEPVKKVIVKINWQEQQDLKDVTLNTFISEGGL